MTPQPHDQATRAYYDEFAARYEDARRPNDPDGYHALLDDLEVDFTERYSRGRDVLEVGCGTGLLLSRLAPNARRAEGVDLSPGMLAKARDRGLKVREGSATELPYEDHSFDVVVSFKVLAHVPDIGLALLEMARVTKPGGVMLAEFYNPVSFRGLAKILGPAGKIGEQTRENAVYTRFDPPWRVRKLLPPHCAIEATRGVRIVTPAAAAMKIPGLRRALRWAEWSLCDSPLAYFGGFWIAAIRKSVVLSITILPMTILPTTGLPTAIAQPFDLNLHGVLTERFGTAPIGHERQAIKTFHHPALIAHKVRVLLAPMTLRGGGFKPPHVIAHVRAAREANARKVEQVAVKRRFVPALRVQVNGDVPMAQRRLRLAEHREDGHPRSRRPKTSETQLIAERTNVDVFRTLRHESGGSIEHLAVETSGFGSFSALIFSVKTGRRARGARRPRQRQHRPKKAARGQ